MLQPTRFTARTKASLRECLLDAAAEQLAGAGFHGLRMGDVATAAGVSRQTVYNEFGNKDALVDAVALRTTAEFLEGIDARMEQAPDFLTGFRATVTYTLRHAEENPLVAAILGTPAAEDLLPLLTSRGGPVLRSSAELFRTHLRQRLPSIPAGRAALIAENAVRLVLSHLVLPTSTPEQAAHALAELLAPLLHQEGPP